ncbi:hypothetical protein JCM17960_19780 [Magnetospira thiophila]
MHNIDTPTVTPTTFQPDPLSYSRTIAHFDVTRGQVAYHRHCQEQFRRGPVDASHPIRTHHLTTLRLLDRQTCATYRSYIDQGAQRVEQHDLLTELLESFFSPETDRALTAYFGSEYHADWYSFQATFPNDRHIYSNDWHFDAGSSRQIKILCFLNDVEDHAAPTLYLPLVQSQILARKGYGFPPMEARLADLSGLARSMGVEYSPQAVPLAAGEALLFNPQTLLHRGQPPRENPRYVIQVNIIPSPIPWRTALQTDRYWPRFEPGSCGWPPRPLP